MKMNNRMKAVIKIVEGLIFIAIGLSMVGCEEAKEVENIAIQDTKQVVEYCEYCGGDLQGGFEVDENLVTPELKDFLADLEVRYGDCGECQIYEVLVSQDIQELGEVNTKVALAHLDKCDAIHTPIDAPQVKEEVEKAVCYTCGVEVDEATAHYNGRSYRCEGCYWTEQGLETPNAEATKCDACGTTNIEVMDSAGGYICNECGHCN